LNTKDSLRLGVPLGQSTRHATDFVAKFMLCGGDKSWLHEEVEERINADGESLKTESRGKS
jgi:hypothetical protein